jgi:tripartite-type tricarboxylate transporter receptor subunit TctC
MTMLRTARVLAAGAAAAAIAMAAGTAPAQSVAEFYTGKTVTIIIAAGPGGNHSNYSLLLAPYWKKYMPGNPNFIIQNMGGAGGTKAANFLYNSAPQDGSHIGILLSDTPLAARVRATGVKYDPSKFQFLGGADWTRSMVSVWRGKGIATIDDAKKKEVICGSSGKGSQTFMIPMLANHFLGTKFKVITGYRGMNGVDAAVDKGEVFCRAGVYESIVAIRPHWLTEKKVVHIAAADLERLPAEPNIPTMIEMTNDPDAKAVLRLFFSGGIIGRAWLAPPKVPADRVAALRDAFWKAFNDPAAQAEMTKRKMRYEPVPWQKQQETVAAIMSAPNRLFDIARTALGIKAKK